jgi:MFS transporter, YNFM family, putative membrane transport protein
MMTAALLVAGTFGVAAAFAPSYPVLLLLRALQGIALGGVQAVAMTYLAEEVHHRSLGFATGLYVAGNGIGGMAGRLIAGLITDAAGWRWAVGTIGVLGLCCTLVFRLSIPASRRFRAGLPAQTRVTDLVTGVGRALTDTGLIRLYAVGFLLMGCFVTVYNYLGFRLLAGPFHLSQAVVGLIFVAYLAGSLGSTVAGKLADKYGRPTVFRITAIITLAGLVMTLPANLPLVIVGLVVVTGGFFAAHAVASGWVANGSVSIAAKRGAEQTRKQVRQTSVADRSASITAKPGAEQVPARLQQSSAGDGAVRGQGRKAQSAAVYLLCYYVGSSVGGSVGGLAFGAAGWSGTVAYTGGLIAAALLLGMTLSSRSSTKSHDAVRIRHPK